MNIKQISIFLENKSGRLTEVLSILGEEKIHIHALTIADTSEYGILRLIVSDLEKTVQILKAKTFAVSLTDVIAVSTPSEAGSFAKVLRSLSDANLSIEYMYAFKWSTNAAMILRPDNIPLAMEVLQKQKFVMLSAENLENL